VGQYEPLIVGRPAFISFQTAAELCYGAMLRGWGDARMLDLQARIAAAEVVHTGPDLIEVYARLRVVCRRAGHGLSQREHDADRWIAAAAIRLGPPLVSNDAIFEGVPGLVLESAHNAQAAGPTDACPRSPVLQRLRPWPRRSRCLAGHGVSVLFGHFEGLPLL
jgi:predicted nucleic acid-binding protein